MPQPAYLDISAGMATTFAVTPGLKIVQNALSLKESIADVPCLQIYLMTDDPVGETERVTFQRGVDENMTVWNCDLYAHERGDLGENMLSTYEIGHAMKTILRDRTIMKPPFFGVDGIKAIHWRAERIQIENAAQQFMAMRFVITLWLF